MDRASSRASSNEPAWNGNGWLGQYLALKQAIKSYTATSISAGVSAVVNPIYLQNRKGKKFMGLFVRGMWDPSTSMSASSSPAMSNAPAKK